MFSNLACYQKVPPTTNQRKEPNELVAPISAPSPVEARPLPLAVSLRPSVAAAAAMSSSSSWRSKSSREDDRAWRVGWVGHGVYSMAMWDDDGMIMA